MSKILALQKRGIRHIMGLKYRDSCRDHFRQLKIMTAPALYILQCIKIAARHPEKIVRNQEVHTHNTRHGDRMRMEKFKKVKCEKLTPSHQGLKFIRSLPQELAQSIGSRSFEKEVKRLLIEKVPYKIEEFVEN